MPSSRWRVRRPILIFCALASLAVWAARDGQADRRALREAQTAQRAEFAAMQINLVLRGLTVFAGVMAEAAHDRIVPDGPLPDLDRTIRTAPILAAILVSDAEGRLIAQAHRDGFRVPLASDVSVIPGSRVSQHVMLVRSSEASSMQALLGVRLTTQAGGDDAASEAGKISITLIIRGADLPRLDLPAGQTWIIAQDGAAVAEPGRSLDRAALEPVARALQAGHVTLASGAAMSLRLHGAVHLLQARPIGDWPLTLVTDFGPDTTPLLLPQEIIAGVLAVLALLVAATSVAGARGAASRTGAAVSRHHATASMQTLLAGIVHDIANFLTVLSFDAEMVAMDGLAPGALAQLSRSMLTATERGGEYLQLLLCLAEHVPLQPRPIVLLELLKAQHALLHACLDDTQQLIFRPVGAGADEAGTASVALDLAALLTCLQALLRRAGRGAGSGGVVTLGINCQEVANRRIVQLTVAGASGPSGSPVPALPASPISLRAVLDPLALLDGEDSHGGLALAASCGFARQSEGRLLLDHAAAVTSPVVLEFPVHQPGMGLAGPHSVTAGGLMRDRAAKRSGLLVERAADAARLEERRAAPGARVLLVDDQADVLASIARRLQLVGYEVVAAQSVAEAERAALGEVDVLVTDVVLEDAIDGWALAARLRERRPGLPVVFLSGFLSARQSELMAGDEMASFLRKPVDAQDLRHVIDGLLAMRETRRLAVS